MWGMMQAHDSLEAAPPAQLRSIRRARVEPTDADDAAPPSEDLPDTNTLSRMTLLPDVAWKSDGKVGAAGKKQGGGKRDYRSQGGLTSFLDYFLLRALPLPLLSAAFSSCPDCMQPFSELPTYFSTCGGLEVCMSNAW